VHQEAQASFWTAEYYDNTNLTGSPVRTIEEARIDFKWGDGGPPNLPDNYFSIRWTGNWLFEVGDYTFFVYADDGVRLWLDDQLLIDAWRLGMGEHVETVRIEQAGLHRVRVEYFESRGDAGIRVHWRRTDLFPQWDGNYYNNAWVEGGKSFGRTDSAIQFDWGEDCPDRLPPNSCNRFSAAWTARPILEPGTHRIHVYADQGYRLYVDGSLKGDDGWYGGESAEDDWYDITVSRLESRQIEFNFHDQGGPAEARLWIENLAHPLWNVEYYDNQDLYGTPVHTDTETAIFHDWGLDNPRHGVSRNHFSVRWTGKRYFHAGFYRFGLFFDDGVRLWVDGKLLYNAWHLGRGGDHAPVTYLSTGYHDIMVEYFENEGEAEIRLWWE
jgi:hypothetical protein